MKKISTHVLKTMKNNKEKFAVVTAYDYAFSKMISSANIEVTLVGDSLGNVVQGHSTTIPVTIEDMAYHMRAVHRGNINSLLVCDMPFMSYSTTNDALKNAATLMQAGAQMVKVEGGEWLADSVYKLCERGIPVCSHLGLTPQSINKLGGNKVQGIDKDNAEKMVKEALILEEAGADLLVVECVPSCLGADLTNALSIPVIGIGAGPSTDGQVLVVYDMIGLSDRLPKFAENFLDKAAGIQEAISLFGSEVRSGAFPGPDNSFK
jgi:3-methyl-2-oxobutanoate hydroxymethyltransferase